MARRRKRVKTTKLTTDIRKLAAQIIVVSTDEGVDGLASEIVEKANKIDARDERKKPTVRRRRAVRRKAKRPAVARKTNARPRPAARKKTSRSRRRASFADQGLTPAGD